MKLALAAAVTAAMLFVSTDCAPAPSPHVMPRPEVRFVVWGAQDPAPLETDWRALCAAGVLDRLAEYGVHGCTLGMTTTALPDLAPGVYDDAWVVGSLLNEIDASTPGVAWVVVLPPGSSTTYLNAQGFAGYHFWGVVPYAVVTANEVLISHEVYETATDPDGLGVHVQGQEVGDLCEEQTDTIGGVVVQKVWSVRAGACL